MWNPLLNPFNRFFKRFALSGHCETSGTEICSYQEQDEGGGERDAAELAVARQVGLGELGHGVYPPRRHLE